MGTKELKRCPFCGRQDTVDSYEFDGEFHVGCELCNVGTGEFNTIEEAIGQWNTRPQLSDEEIETAANKYVNVRAIKDGALYKPDDKKAFIAGAKYRTHAVQPSLVEALDIDKVKGLVEYAWNNGLCSFHDTKTHKTYNAELSDFMDEIEDDIQALAHRKEEKKGDNQ